MKHVTRRMSLALCSLVLVVLLAACGGAGGIAASTPTPPPPTQTPSPTPTPAVTVYTGDGYTINYPQDWKKSTSVAQTTFQDSLGVNVLGIVIVPNPNGIAQPGTALNTTLAAGVKGVNMTNTSPANLPASATLAGETWMQKGTMGTASKNGASSSFEVVVLAVNHPANTPNTKLFELVYAGPLLGSTLLDAQIFQAMLASFKFTS
ncbi:MAG: hypothetical protein ACRDHW_12040 [Ktedonobacteraceae bacterium]